MVADPNVFVGMTVRRACEGCGVDIPSGTPDENR
jgi:hypothetical protein